VLSELAALNQAIRRRLRRWYRRVGLWWVLLVLGAGGGLFVVSFVLHTQRVGATPFSLNYDQWQGSRAALGAGFELGALILWLGACGVVASGFRDLLRELPPPHEWRMRRALFTLLTAVSGAVWLLLLLASSLPTVIQVWAQNVFYTPLLGAVLLTQGERYLAEFLQPALWLCALAALVPARFNLVWLWATPLLLLFKLRQIAVGVVQALWGGTYGSDYLRVPLSVFLERTPATWGYQYSTEPLRHLICWYWLAGGVVVALLLLAFRRPGRIAHALLAVCALSALWLQIAALTPSPWHPGSMYGGRPTKFDIDDARGDALRSAGILGAVVQYGSGPAEFLLTRLAQYNPKFADSGLLILSGPLNYSRDDFPARWRGVAPLVNLGWLGLICLFIYFVVLGEPRWRRRVRLPAQR
jgi:hypothetical protein